MATKKTRRNITTLLPAYRMKEAAVADKRLESAMEQTLKRTYLLLEARSNEPYDGILGSLHKDWPEKDHIEFEAARNQVLTKFSHDEALTYLKAYPKHFSRNYHNRPLVPLSILKPLATLHYYYDAMKQPPEKGLSKLIGSTIAGHAKQGRKYLEQQSEIARRPRGVQALRKIVARLARDENKAAIDAWQEFLGELGTEGYEPKEQTHGTLRITYCNDNGGVKEITFRRFQNLLSECRRSNNKSR